LGSQPVQVWRLNLRIPVHAQVTPAQVISQDEDEVRARSGFLFRAAGPLRHQRFKNVTVATGAGRER
jgi:hypothetical protein